MVGSIQVAARTMGKKIKLLQELEEHGEPMVKIAKVKGKMKQKVSVTSRRAESQD